MKWPISFFGYFPFWQVCPTKSVQIPDNCDIIRDTDLLWCWLDPGWPIWVDISQQCWCICAQTPILTCMSIWEIWAIYEADALDLTLFGVFGDQTRCTSVPGQLWVHVLEFEIPETWVQDSRLELWVQYLAQMGAQVKWVEIRPILRKCDMVWWLLVLYKLQ